MEFNAQTGSMSTINQRGLSGVDFSSKYFDDESHEVKSPYPSRQTLATPAT